MKDSFLANYFLPQVKGELFLPLNEFSKRKHVEALCGTKKDVAHCELRVSWFQLPLK